MIQLSPNWMTVTLLALDALARFGIALRVVMRRLPVGVTLAWLLVVIGFPVAGPVIYLLIGELRLGDRRARRAALVHRPFLDWLKDLNRRHEVTWTDENRKGEPLARLVEKVTALPPLPGNRLELLDDSEAILRRLIHDIDSARSSCHLEFYIWSAGGLADEVAAALERASARGVACRVLLDAVGSHDFLVSERLHQMEASGIRVSAALRVSLFRMLFVRFDLRLHRKIVVIDGQLAYTGSMNLVDPRFFKQDSHVGEWVDAMVRIEGPGVEALAVTFLEDWALETGETLEELRRDSDVKPLQESGPATIQIFPSGPMHQLQTIESALMVAIYAAQRELVLTSPYFVPDESMMTALLSAALRGVAVTLVLPARLDSNLVRLASRTYQGDLAEAGVRVLLFEHGLLHTKSVTVDGDLSLFGSLNLDPRSFHLNFEITLLGYDRGFTTALRGLQESYIARSKPLDLERWQRRSGLERLAENLARLMSPLL